MVWLCNITNEVFLCIHCFRMLLSKPIFHSFPPPPIYGAHCSLVKLIHVLFSSMYGLYFKAIVPYCLVFIEFLGSHYTALCFDAKSLYFCFYWSLLCHPSLKMHRSLQKIMNENENKIVNISTGPSCFPCCASLWLFMLLVRNCHQH